MGLEVNKYVPVGEYREDVDTGVFLKNGDFLDLSASGTIWAGVWFTGRNSPEGWVGWHAPADCPLPGVAPYSLLGKTAEDGYFLIGKGLRRQFLNNTVPVGGTRLYFRINDSVPGNGNGSFQVHVMVWR